MQQSNDPTTQRYNPMTLFILGTLLLLAFLAWGTWHTARVLREFTPPFNLLLLPAENLLRLALIGACFWLGMQSGQSFAQLGWQSVNLARDVLAGFFVGVGCALIVPPLTHWAIARFGTSVYSPLVVLNILPRNAREWALVPLALVPAVFLEELLFRSLLLGGFGTLAPPLVLALVWSLFFGAMHLPQGALGIAVAAALGVILSFLFLATQSLLAPVLAHYLINLLQLAWAAREKTWLEQYYAHSSHRL
jgi:membrane protease YdiL (CAAX protease family)